MSPKRPKSAILDNGFIVPHFFKDEFELSTTYVAGPGDVFICTYPKCGTTWAQNILHLLQNRGQPLEAGRNINETIPHLEDQGKAYVEQLPRPRIIKTHLPFSMLPKSSDAKYLYVARNPKDCCVSFFFHTRGFANYDYDGSFEEYFKLFLDGEVDYGDFFDHLLGYLNHNEDIDMLVMLYEDMKEDTKGSIIRIGKFLGGRFAEAVDDSEVLEKVVQNCSFGKMKDTPRMWSTEQVAGSEGFIRRGEVGDWRNHFSEEQSKLMDEKFRVKLGGTEAEHLWDKYDCL